MNIFNHPGLTEGLMQGHMQSSWHRMLFKVRSLFLPTFLPYATDTKGQILFLANTNWVSEL